MSNIIFKKIETVSLIFPRDRNLKNVIRLFFPFKLYSSDFRVKSPFAGKYNGFIMIVSTFMLFVSCYLRNI